MSGILFQDKILSSLSRSLEILLQIKLLELYSIDPQAGLRLWNMTCSSIWSTQIHVTVIVPVKKGI